VAPGEVLGVDFQAGVIERAQAAALDAGLRNLQFEDGNIDGLELPETTFDLVHFSGTLGYLKDPLAALKLAFRALQPGGLVGAREPQTPTSVGLVEDRRPARHSRLLPAP
jgi:ubiquinone/menaquinone biosynthesis C-methylase UbiE